MVENNQKNTKTKYVAIPIVVSMIAIVIVAFSFLTVFDILQTT